MPSRTHRHDRRPRTRGPSSRRVSTRALARAGTHASVPALARALALAGCCLSLALVLAQPAWSDTAPWQTDPLVGPSEVTYTLTFTCTGLAAICDPLNAYSDTQVSTLTDAATLQLDADADTLQFDQDGTQDLDDGMGPIPTYVSLAGSDLTFAGLALFGIPEVVNPVVFSADQPLITLAGLELLPPGSYAISTTMLWGGVADVIGDLSLLLPGIVVTPSPVSVTGTLEVLGDVDLDGQIEFEIRDLQATTQSTDQYVEPGVATVDVHVTADLLANLSGEVAAPAVPPVPMLGLPGAMALIGLLGGLGLRHARRRSHIG